MKRINLHSLIVMTSIVILLIVVFRYVPVQRASAALGNEGIPARCSITVSEFQAKVFICSASGGLSMSGGITPAGYYFLITDIVFSPASGTGTGAHSTSIDTSSANGTHTNPITVTTNDKYGGSFHFTTPYLVVDPINQIVATQKTGASTAVTVYLAGVLTTNVTYLPLVNR
jgi:hypothetical protein